MSSKWLKTLCFFRDELVLILKRFNVQVLNVLKTNLFQIYVHMKHAGRRRCAFDGTHIVYRAERFHL